MTSADTSTIRSLIVTLTMNPALDLTTNTQVVGPTHKIRCGAVRYDAGGGGINVARVARALGGSVSAVLPAGGRPERSSPSWSQVREFRITV